MAATQFFYSATSYSTSNTLECLSRTVMEFYRVKTKSRPEYTTTSCFTRRHFTRIFRITVNFTTFRTISSFLEVLPVSEFYFRFTDFDLVAPGCLTGSISNRLSAIQQPYGPDYGKDGRPRDARGRTGSRNMAATRFFDSATQTSYSASNTSLSHSYGVL